MTTVNTGDQIAIRAPGRSPFTVVLGEQLGSRGSQGVVYGLPARPALAVKILAGTTAGRAAGKINAMLAGDRDWTVRGGKIKVTWPVALAESTDGRFLGYAMYRLDSPGHLALKPAISRIGVGVADSDWLWHFNVCEDLARTLVHVGEQRHVVGDLAPPNIFVTASAASVIVDVDGWQVYGGRSNGHFPCEFSRPDYTAPEHLDSDGRRRPQSDWWALAVLIGEILFLGSHPFGGVPRKGHRLGAEEDDNVRQRQCWLLGGEVDVTPGTLPRDLLPTRLMRLFERCFEKGYDRPDLRPSPETWADALDMAWRELTVCDLNHRHFYPSERRTCPWCEQKALSGHDHFPAPRTGRTPAGAGRTASPDPVQPAPPPDPVQPAPAPDPVRRVDPVRLPVDPDLPMGGFPTSHRPTVVPPAGRAGGAKQKSRGGGVLGVFVVIVVLVLIVAFVSSHS